jgi:adenylylsulfate kinase
MSSSKKRQPAVLWFTGLSGSGKSTIAESVFHTLRDQNYAVEYLDGDAVRSVFPDTGFTRPEREKHIERIGFLAGILEKNEVLVIASFISPYLKSRKFVRDQCQKFIEIYISTPLSECEKRDVKGLYAKARKSEIKNFTGISDPYEAPVNPEINIDTSKVSIQASADLVLEYFRNNI